MGWAKYLEDNNEILQDRMENRATRAEREYRTWSRDTAKVNEIIKAKEDQEAKKGRIREILEIKESLSYKINLSLTVASSVTNYTIQCVAKALNIGLEDSYSKVGKIIHSIDGHESVNVVANINVDEIKKNLVKNIFYKVENVINNSDEISQEEMGEIKEELLKLIFWFYNKEATIGRIGKEVASRDMAKKFIKDEMEADMCACPICGHETIDGLKYCIECAREW